MIAPGDASPGSLHDDAVSVLTGWEPRDAGSHAAQAVLRDDYVAFLAAHDNAMWRSCVAGHLTASAMVLAADRSSVLLTLHPKFDRWLQMGGHCEPGDRTVHEAAAREALEESGIAGLVLSRDPVRLDRHRVGCHGGSWHLDVQYTALAPVGAVAQISDESLELRWWPVDALPEDTDDSVRRLVETALHSP